MATLRLCLKAVSVYSNYFAVGNANMHKNGQITHALLKNQVRGNVDARKPKCDSSTFWPKMPPTVDSVATLRYAVPVRTPNTNGQSKLPIGSFGLRRCFPRKAKKWR